jgi:hypothetical protein
MALLSLLALVMPANASPGDSLRAKRWYVPHYVPLQFAGNIGFLSTGLGYETNSGNYHLNLLYGYVPASVGQHYVHMITAKNIFPLRHLPLSDHQSLAPYLGLGLMVEVGGNAFFTLPSHYPDGYYDFPKNLHVTGFAGVRLRHLFRHNITFLRGMDIYAEAGTIDVYVWYRTISDEIKFNQMFSLALGLNFLLQH